MRSTDRIVSLAAVAAAAIIGACSSGTSQASAPGAAPAPQSGSGSAAATGTQGEAHGSSAPLPTVMTMTGHDSATQAKIDAAAAAAAVASGRGGGRAGRGGGGGRANASACRGCVSGPIDTVRARQLYVGIEPKDLPAGNYDNDMAGKKRSDSIYAARFAGKVDFQKITYKSRAGGLEIPAYLFAPLNKRGPKGHAAMIWVHGGVHGNWDQSLLAFVKEAVDRGYVIVTPDYRGSTGHGEAFHQMIDYGGDEVVDVTSALDYLKTLPYVDMDRVGMMGWSHGGFITAHNAMTKGTPLKAAAAIVPVTNLPFRLSLKGPGYQRSYAAESTIRGLPFEKPDEYLKRSPLYHVEDLGIPLLVHISTNDLDVNYVEDQQLVWKLRALKPELAETKIYVDPPGWGASVGHAFSRRTDPVTLDRVDSPEQIDSWNRTWAFFDWNLRPYEDRSKPVATPRITPDGR